MKRYLPLCLATALGCSILGNAVLISRAKATRTNLHNLPATPTPQPEQNNPEALKQQMLDARYPNAAIVAALRELIEERDAHLLSIGRSMASRWRPIVRTPPDQEILREQMRRKEVQELSGLVTDIPPDPLSREAGWENLSEKDLIAVQSVERKYAAVRNAEITAPGQKPNPESIARIARATNEYEAELTAVLGQEGARDYLRFFSLGALAVQRRLAGIEVDQATYNDLADAGIALDRTRRTPGMNRLDFDRAADVLYHKYHDDLGDERFLHLIGYFNGLAASADKIYVGAKLPATQRSKLFFIAHDAVIQIYRDPGAYSSSRIARETYNQLLKESGLTGPGQAAFDRSPLGGLLRSTAGPFLQQASL